MKLSLTQKRILGAATLWMLVYPFVFLVLWFAMFAAMLTMIDSRGDPPIAFFAILICSMPITFFTVFLNLVLMGIYWAHIIKNNTTADVWRIIFGICIFLFAYFAMPIYFYFFVWRDETPTWARPNTPAQSVSPVVP